MDTDLWSTLQDLGYKRARRVLLGIGMLVLLVISGVLYARRVDTVEVIGTLLFMVVFVGFVLGRIRWGIIGAFVAAAVYAWLRLPAVEAVGADRFTSLILSRGVAYLLFGIVGGWAAHSLESSLTKLELYDQIDDSTGLFNARYFLQDTDLEISRSRRYSTIFSVAVTDIPTAAVEALPARQKKGMLRGLGRLMRQSVRTVDRPIFGSEAERHRLAVVLPETGPEGARIFADRLAERVADFLRQQGAEVSVEQMDHAAVSFPDDEIRILSLREEFAEIDRMEHPEAAEVVGAAAAES